MQLWNINSFCLYVCMSPQVCQPRSRGSWYGKTKLILIPFGVFPHLTVCVCVCVSRIAGKHWPQANTVWLRDCLYRFAADRVTGIFCHLAGLTIIIFLYIYTLDCVSAYMFFFLFFTGWICIVLRIRLNDCLMLFSDWLKRLTAVVSSCFFY